MAYFLLAIRTVITVLVFYIAAKIASTDFQNVVVAGIGFLYVTTNIGIISLRYQNTQNLIFTMEMFNALAQNIPDYKEDIDPQRSSATIFKANKNLENLAIINSIDVASNVIVILGCLYLVAVSV